MIVLKIFQFKTGLIFLEIFKHRPNAIIIKMKWKLGLGVALFVACAFLGMHVPVHAQDTTSRRLITLYDRGQTTIFLTDAKTLGEALSQENIQLDPRDTVEPSRDEELVASEYKVNIYRARPVVIVDCSVRTKTVSPYQTPERIAKDAGFTLNQEDTVTLEASTDYVYDGAGLKLVIDRSLPVKIDLYGRQVEVHTQARNVGDMLEEKNIRFTDNDRVQPDRSTPITSGMAVRVWREGKQTLSVDQAIPYSRDIIYDADRPLGYRVAQTAGTNGMRTHTYEIEIRDGKEISRVEIANIVTRQPVKQVEVIGIYNNGAGLSQGKGAQYWTDSKGVSHRETYYDLDMGRVMQSCGQGGYYTVRPDGAKVDRDGYILIAANYGMYPKCSLVETSLGTGKVYDTGGFAAKHPTGFDLATDWSNRNGR
jgi:uncharacterized protein YabE (DUF348 family)